MAFSPRKIMHLTGWGQRDVLVSANTPWICASCHACEVRCPRGIDIPRVMESLRQLFLRENDGSLCFQCHESTLVLEERTTTLTNFRDGDRNLHYLHVNSEKGRSCRACHEVHASNLPFHMRVSVPYGESDWLLPINFAKTETGGTCTPGCHQTAAYAN